MTAHVTPPSHGTLILITGLRGAGKTELCQRIVQVAERNAWVVAGVICALAIEDDKTGIQAEDLQTHERRLLARRVFSPLEAAARQWKFDGEAFAWGNERIRKAGPCDLFVIDEIGPMEFYHQGGWQAGLEKLDLGDFRIGVAVVRPDLIEAARKRWPHALIMDVRSSQADPTG